MSRLSGIVGDCRAAVGADSRTGRRPAGRKQGGPGKPESIAAVGCRLQREDSGRADDALHR